VIYKWVGITDEVTTCEICGKEYLKKTIMLANEEGNISYMGCCCAAKAMGRSYSETKKRQDQEARRLAREAKEKAKQIAKEACIAYRSHPEIKAIEEEINTCNRNNIPPKNRPIKAWCDVKNKVKSLISKQYGVEASCIY